MPRKAALTLEQKRAKDAANDRHRTDLDFMLRQAEFERNSQIHLQEVENNAKVQHRQQDRLEQESQARQERQQAQDTRSQRQQTIRAVGNAITPSVSKPKSLNLSKHSYPLGFVFLFLIVFLFLGIQTAPGQSVSRLSLMGMALIGKATVKQ